MTLTAHATLRAVLFDLDDLVVRTAEVLRADGLRAATGARRAVHALRDAGLRVGVLTDADEVADATDPIARRLDELAGPFDGWFTRAAEADEQDGVVALAASKLALDPGAVVLVGGTLPDVAGAREAGAASILLTGGTTTSAEVESADVVVDSLVDAAALVLHSLRR